MLYVIELFLYTKIFILFSSCFLLFTIYNAAVNIHTYMQMWNFSIMGIYILKLLDTAKFLFNMSELIFNI